MSSVADQGTAEKPTKATGRSRKRKKRMMRKGRKRQALEEHSLASGGACSQPLKKLMWEVVDTGGVSVEQTGFLMLEEYSGTDYKVVDGQLVLPQHARAITSVVQEKTLEEISASRAALEESANSGESDSEQSIGKSEENVVEVEVNEEEGVGLEQWRDYGLHPLLLNGISRLGFEEPTEIQRLCLPKAIRDGRDVLGTAETGSGKTLAYGLPLLNSLLYDGDDESKREGKLKALILTPTRELAFQVSRHLSDVLGEERKRMVATVVGGMSQEKQRRILGKKPPVLVVTPGRFWALVQDGVEHLSDLQNSLRFLVVDEADRMLDKGHFPELKPLISLLHKKEGKGNARRQTFLFSATLFNAREITKQRKRKRKREQTVSPFLRLIQQVGVRGKPAICTVAKAQVADEGGVAQRSEEQIHLPAGLTLAKLACTEKSKCHYTYYLLQNYEGRILIFVNTISTLRRVSKLFQLLQIDNLACLHANMQQKQRLKALERFRKNKNGVLVATDVAARGLDIPDVDFVIHYGIPRSVDSFVHRSGRTARARKDGVSLALVSPQEQASFQKIVQLLPNDQQIDTFPVDQSYLPQVKERVNVATQLERAQRFASKASADRLWRKQHAEKAELVLDSDSESDVDTRRKSEANNANIKRLQQTLKFLLRDRIVPVGTSTKFVTVNPFLTEESLKQSSRDLMLRKRSVVTDARRSKHRKKRKKRR